ncbi:MAG: hypothetical protein J1E39_05405 [Eubacterium sp.]|nr:hypothetical protein [Eubacterium sp.]
MKITLFELKKLVTSKLFIASTALLLLAYLVTIIPNIDSDAKHAKQTADYINTRVPDVITQEYTNELIAKNEKALADALGALGENAADGQTLDLGEFYYEEVDIQAQLEYASVFHRHRLEALTLAIKSKTDTEAGGDIYKQRYNEQIINSYNQVIDITLIGRYANNDYFERFYGSLWVQRKLFPIIFVLWAMLQTAYLLCCERASRSDMVTAASKGGRSAMFLHKLGAVTVTVFTATLLMYIVQMIIAYAVYRLDMYASIQSMSRFEYCPYLFNIIGTYTVMQLMLFGAAMTGVFVAALFSIRAAYPVRGILLSFVVMFAVYRIFLLFIGNGVPKEIADMFGTVRMYVPLYMIYPEFYFTDFDYGALFDFPVSRLAVVAVITVIFGIISTFICAKLYGKGIDFSWKAKLSSLTKSQKHTAA